MRPLAEPPPRRQLLDAYPLIRSRSTAEARDLVGRALSPHHLHVRAGEHDFEAWHNQIRLDQVAINVLSYGAEVEIDPGERGDFYLLQLPLQGRARLRCNGEEAWVDPDVMGVLQPRAQTRMLWSGDCAMIMLQVPIQVLHNTRGAESGPRGPLPVFSLTRSRREPAVAAWWQAVGDMTRNLHDHGAQWLRYPAAFAAMEAFLLTGLELLRPPPESTGRAAPCLPAPIRHLQRAIDYIHAHSAANLSLAGIAAAACVSPRALEAAFRTHCDTSPLRYVRGVRLDQVRAALQRAAQEGSKASVTDLALQHGFIHLGRFAAYYRQRFGCLPSATLSPWSPAPPPA
jgi:AraC-like DNA-binding protein